MASKSPLSSDLFIRTVWNHNMMSLPVTFDPLECKNFIRHINGTNNKILNSINYNKIFSLVEDQYSQENIEQFQTPNTNHQFKMMYTVFFHIYAC